MSFTPDEKFLDAEAREITYIGKSKFEFSPGQTEAMLTCKDILEKATEACVNSMNNVPHNLGLRTNFRHAMVAVKDLCCSAINLGIPEGQDVRTGKMVTRSQTAK